MIQTEPMTEIFAHPEKVAIPSGYPAIKGACRYGVKDRMERACIHWVLPNVQLYSSTCAASLSMAS